MKRLNNPRTGKGHLEQAFSTMMQAYITQAANPTSALDRAIQLSLVADSRGVPFALSLFLGADVEVIEEYCREFRVPGTIIIVELELKKDLPDFWFYSVFNSKTHRLANIDDVGKMMTYKNQEVTTEQVSSLRYRVGYREMSLRELEKMLEEGLLSVKLEEK